MPLLASRTLGLGFALFGAALVAWFAHTWLGAPSHNAIQDVLTGLALLFGFAAMTGGVALLTDRDRSEKP
jgi:hypothetical protein